MMPPFQQFITEESMLTLFLSISGGVSWIEALDPLSGSALFRVGLGPVRQVLSRRKKKH